MLGFVTRARGLFDSIASEESGSAGGEGQALQARSGRLLANLEEEILRLERDSDPAATLRGVVDDPFESGFIHDTYANRKGTGSDRAVARYEKFRDRFRHVLRCDVYGYFRASTTPFSSATCAAAWLAESRDDRRPPGNSGRQRMDTA